MEKTLKEYILLLAELDCQEKEDEEVDEFSGVGAISGYTLPLGTSPEKIDHKKRNIVRLK